MLILLIPLVFLVLFLNLVGYQCQKQVEFAARKSFLQASVLIGLWIALSSELLSLVKGLTRPSAAIAWGILLGTLLFTGFYKGFYKAGRSYVWNKIANIKRQELVFISGLALVFSLLFVIIYLAPPNNTDSLQYHMSRVVHWAQDQSLRPYPTGFEPQLINPIWAEEAILHIRLLWGDDRFAELVQLFAMFGCMVGVSLLAALLGANRKGQIAAAIFSASIPMGILQATSTQNDYVASFWLVCMAYFGFIAVTKRILRSDLFMFSIALGLGLLTKGTFYPYAVPIILVVVFFWVRKLGFRRTIKIGLAVIGIVIILNLGYWLRNTATFGGPLGPSNWISSMTAPGKGIGYLAASAARNVLMNFVTPYDGINAKYTAIMFSIFGKFDPGLKDFPFLWGWNHEDLGGNPLHVVLILVSSLLLVVFRKQLKDRALWWYTGTVVGMFLMLAMVVKVDVFGIRYQLPFFVSWAPVFGCTISLIGKPRLTLAVAYGLLILMLPWVLFNRTRPLIAMDYTPGPFTIPCDWHFGCTTRSVLSEPPITILFVNIMALRDPYEAMAKTIQSSGCSDIGLQIDSHDPEYIFWWLLNAPQSHKRIETIYTYPELERYVDKAFKPCAIICTICGDRQQLHGLALQSAYGDARLFTGNNYLEQP
jgi:hypothetical protein